LQNINLVSVSKICPNFAGHAWQDRQISWTSEILFFVYRYYKITFIAL
jgi:hypothetical protein